MLVLVVEVFYYNRKKKMNSWKKIANLAVSNSSISEAKLFTTKIQPFDFDKNSSILLGSGHFMPVARSSLKKNARFSPISIVRARD